MKNGLPYNARQKTARPKRKTRWGLLLAVSLLLLSSSYTGLALTKATPILHAEVAEPAVLETSVEGIQWPTQGQAAIGSLRDGLLMSSGNSQMKPIASMTKAITALVVLDRQPIELGGQYPVYTITRQDVQTYNDYIARLGSVMPVRVGQQLDQYQMLQGLMLPSANNIADTLATWVFGSVDAYVTYANNYLQRNGLGHTVVADASGFSPDTMSTPEDLLVIGQMVLNHPVLAEIVAQTEAVIPETGVIKNTNLLLRDENVIGIKTGTTDEAGSCLLFAVKHGPDNAETLIGVVMGQPNWSETYRVARQLRDSALANFELLEIMPEDTVVGVYRTSWGVEVTAKAAESVTVYNWKGHKPKVTVSLDPIKAPQTAGTRTGTVNVDGHAITVPVYLDGSIDAPGIRWRLMNYW